MTKTTNATASNNTKEKTVISAQLFQKKVEMETAQLEWLHYLNKDEAARRAYDTVSSEFSVDRSKASQAS